MPTLLGGDIDFGSVAVVTVLSKISAAPGLFRCAASGAAGLPTARELGVTTSVPPGHSGIFAPKGLPAGIRTALERACADAVKRPTVQRAENSARCFIT